MIEFLKITAKTPYGDTREYAFMGDMTKPEEQERLIEFMMKCCDDCADFFPCPDEWDAKDWRNGTAAMWEAMTSNRTEIVHLPTLFL